MEKHFDDGAESGPNAQVESPAFNRMMRGKMYPAGGERHPVCKYRGRQRNTAVERQKIFFELLRFPQCSKLRATREKFEEERRTMREIVIKNGRALTPKNRRIYVAALTPPEISVLRLERKKGSRIVPFVLGHIQLLRHRCKACRKEQSEEHYRGKRGDDVHKVLAMKSESEDTES